MPSPFSIGEVVVAEKRLIRRMRVLKAGKITFGGTAIDCTVRNPSTSGAQIEVESPLGVPKRFSLIIPSERLSRPCSVMRASERRIGVRFEATDDGGEVQGNFDEAIRAFEETVARKPSAHVVCRSGVQSTVSIPSGGRAISVASMSLDEIMARSRASRLSQEALVLLSGYAR